MVGVVLIIKLKPRIKLLLMILVLYQPIHKSQLRVCKLPIVVHFYYEDFLLLTNPTNFQPKFRLSLGLFNTVKVMGDFDELSSPCDGSKGDFPVTVYVKLFLKSILDLNALISEFYQFTLHVEF